MGSIRIHTVDGEVTLVPDEEARAMLAAHGGEVLNLHRDAEGRLVISAPPQDRQQRLERGKAFVGRYRKTFEALAK